MCWRRPPCVRHGSAHSERPLPQTHRRGTRRRSLKQALSDAAFLFSRSGSIGSLSSARRCTAGEAQDLARSEVITAGTTGSTPSSAQHSASGGTCGTISADSASSMSGQPTSQPRLPVSHAPRPHAVPLTPPFTSAAPPRPAHPDDPLQDHRRYRTVRMLAR